LNLINPNSAIIRNLVLSILHLSCKVRQSRMKSTQSGTIEHKLRQSENT